MSDHDESERPAAERPAAGRPAAERRADEGDDLSAFTAEIADQVETFLLAVRELARGDRPEQAVSMLLLEVSQLLLAGGRLGAITDVVPEEQFEPDVGADPDIDELRVALGGLLDPIDEYVEVFDPYDVEPEMVTCRISDDLCDVAADLLHGLQHYRTGRPLEALWWWQFSYLSHWGSHAATTLRALQSVIGRVRLDSSLSSDADSPDADSPDADSPDADSSDADSSGADSSQSAAEDSDSGSQTRTPV